jgi:hypothetical protein
MRPPIGTQEMTLLRTKLYVPPPWPELVPRPRLVERLSPLVTLPAYQLALPFSPSTWREMSSANALTGTI